jgi:hypothetical protein
MGFGTKGRAGNGLHRIVSRPVFVGGVQVIGTGHQETKAKVGNERHRDQHEGSEEGISRLLKGQGKGQETSTDHATQHLKNGRADGSLSSLVSFVIAFFARPMGNLVVVARSGGGRGKEKFVDSFHGQFGRMICLRTHDAEDKTGREAFNSDLKITSGLCFQWNE